MATDPFTVTARQVELLGPAFTEFANQLLERERYLSGLGGHLLTISHKEETPDGGVDAATRDATASQWIPDGDTAWQFKRSNLGPRACANELQGATWAHDFLRGGGSYVLVLGVDLPDRLIRTRLRDVVSKAVELGLIELDQATRIRVYDANQVARWASTFPALAVSRLVGGPGSGVVDYELWSRSRQHQHEWVGDKPREDAVQVIRDELLAGELVDLRIQGERGVGKTRLVMRALRYEGLERLVVYLSDPREVSGEVLAYLCDAGRRAILVVDNCPTENHVQVAERIPIGAAVQLVTIGVAGGATARRPAIDVRPLSSEVVENFLESNYPTLPVEARRFVAENSYGNLRWVIIMAERVAESPETQAAELIAQNDIEQFVTRLLPEGRDFLFASVLSLFERVGWDKDVRYQLTLLADFAGATLEELDSLAVGLEQRELLVRAGRYRSVSPHPLAVFLAAEGWRREGQRIFRELLPRLDDEMALALFQRVAHLGRFGPAREVLPALLANDGPFSSLERMAAADVGRQLTQLGIVMPDEVALHIGELVETTELEELRRLTTIRRDLVWTLEKLAWHRATFQQAANSLLRLAEAENESFGNNATGTWVQLFGTFLPGTAATPAQRASYLLDLTTSTNVSARRLVVEGASRALLHRGHESIVVSAELQGGVLVEPRGTPATYGEAGEYRRSMVGVLTRLSVDQNPEVESAAQDALIAAMPELVADQFVGSTLTEALMGLNGAAQVRLRASAEQLLAMYGRTASNGRRTGDAVRALLAQLPSQTPLEKLEVLLSLQRWDFGDRELQQRIEGVVRSIQIDAAEPRLLEMLSVDRPATWELGHALAVVYGAKDEIFDALLPPGGPRFLALVGYLFGLVDGGAGDAFDVFLASPRASALDGKQRLAVAVRGPVTDESTSRVLGGLDDLSVAVGTSGLFGWRAELSDRTVAALLRRWLVRVQSEEDYRALLDWIQLKLHARKKLPRSLESTCVALAQLRRQYPDVGREAWTWCEIARRLSPEAGPGLINLLFDLVGLGLANVHADGPEGQLINALALAQPEAAWLALAGWLAKGSWRVQLDFRGWFVGLLPVDLLARWIGSSLDRARIVASMAPAGGDEPTEVCRFLLGAFGDDQKVASSLAAEFVSGSWIGNESDRLKTKIKQLNGWRTRSREAVALRRWAARVIAGLEADLLAVQQREAEGQW